MNEFQTYILYYFVVISTSIIVSLSGKIRNPRLKFSGKLIFWFAIIIPFIVSGFRYGIGVDYFNYVNIYYRLTSASIIDNISNTRFEPSWILLNHLVKYIFDDVKYIFIISSLLILVFNFKAIYDHKSKINIGIAVLILMTTMYNPSFNLVRLYIAASIIMLAVKPILKRKPIKFCITILFASSFHYSALFFLPTYWIVNSRVKNISLVKNVVAILFTISLLVFAKPITSFITTFDIFSAYRNYTIEYDDFGFGLFILQLPIILLILLNFKKLRLEQNKMYLIIIIYFIGIILGYYSYIADNIDRIAIYFEMMQIFIVAAIVKIQKNKYEKLIYSSLIVLFFLGLYTYRILIHNGHTTIPYLWIQ